MDLTDGNTSDGNPVRTLFLLIFFSCSELSCLDDCRSKCGNVITTTPTKFGILVTWPTLSPTNLRTVSLEPTTVVPAAARTQTVKLLGSSASLSFKSLPALSLTSDTITQRCR
jgi:hypothetical protein